MAFLRDARVVLLLFAAVALAGCESSYDWGWHILDPTLKSGRQNLLFLLDGYLYTLSLSFVGMFFSLLIGLALVVASFFKIKKIQFFVSAYIVFFRAVPLLVLILWVYYGLPILAGINLSPFVASVISLALADSAFEAEVFRSGIQSIPKGQFDAADALGLTLLQKFRLVVLPQVIRIILPTLINQFVYMLKMSALASFIGLTDLTRLATELVVISYRPLEVYSFLILEYMILILAVTWFAHWLEGKLRIEDED